MIISPGRDGDISLRLDYSYRISNYFRSSIWGAFGNDKLVRAKILKACLPIKGETLKERFVAILTLRIKA